MVLQLQRFGKGSIDHSLQLLLQRTYRLEQWLAKGLPITILTFTVQRHHGLAADRARCSGDNGS